MLFEVYKNDGNLGKFKLLIICLSLTASFLHIGRVQYDIVLCNKSSSLSDINGLFFFFSSSFFF